VLGYAAASHRGGFFIRRDPRASALGRAETDIRQGALAHHLPEGEIRQIDEGRGVPMGIQRVIAQGRIGSRVMAESRSPLRRM
ncbi:MAG: hypothetical protein ACU0BG_15255, partial [Paracoccus sp. (in: a-proteobacteria)]|uniref:hypothetical protein n=1 Tax=Paracoccus sp. TaxID=267 RepID=UPI0040585325